MTEERSMPGPPEDLGLEEAGERRATWGRVGGVILAAGASSRLGAPKAELDLDGRPALARIMAVLRAAGVGGGTVVVGPDGPPPGVDLGSFRLVTNPDPAAGRTGSLQAGLAATGGDVILWPVDRPLAAGATVTALLVAAADPEADWIVPFHEGHGHPILLRARLRAALLAAPPDADLREILSAAGTRRLAVPVDDPFIHANLDTPESAAEWIARWRESRAR
jgi:molybdenum cofactor cytidylyltransferase